MFSALYDTPRAYPFGPSCAKCITAVTPNDLEKATGKGFLVLWGGEDISPSIYGAKNNPHTYASETPSLRDRLEMNLAAAAQEMGLLIVGICRGAQLMCALSGGKLIQHCYGHHSTHNIVTKDGEVMAASSLHHQMLYPWDVEHEMIAWAYPSRSSNYYLETNDPITPHKLAVNEAGEVCEPEILYFPKTHALCIQGHPEYMMQDERFVQYCNELVRAYVD